MNLEGKVAVVTGGGNGIGRACCERFASDGADVVVADIQDDRGDEVVTSVKERGREALFVHLDAASEADNDAMIERTLERFGRVDVLVTAAGIAHAGYVSGDEDQQKQWFNDLVTRFGQPAAGLLDLEIDAWRTVLDVNLTGTMLAVRSAARAMVEARSGSIVTIASIAAKRPDAGPAAYSVSKAGVWMFTKAAARQLGPLGIRVNAIGPGFIETNMTAILRQPPIVDLLMAQIPMARIGQAEEIASVASFLSGDDAAYVTGEIIHADGGFYTE